MDNARTMDFLYMPWLSISQPITIGRVTFSPAKCFIESDTADTESATMLRKLFNCFVNEVGEPILSPTICHLADRTGFPELSPDEAVEIRRAVDCLCFASVFYLAHLKICNDYYGYWSTQCFTLMRHTCKADVDRFAIRTNVIYAANCSYKHYRCHKPFGLDCAAPGFDKAYLELFSRLLDSSNTKLNERIFRSLERARFAQDDSDAVTEVSKIVMMATAFEILLGITGNVNKTELLMKVVDDLCRSLVSATKLDVIK